MKIYIKIIMPVIICIKLHGSYKDDEQTIRSYVLYIQECLKIIQHTPEEDLLECENSEDRYGNNLAHYAAKNKKLEDIEMLIKGSDIDLDKQNRQKITPIMIAANHNHAEIVETLAPYASYDSLYIARSLTTSNQTSSIIDNYLYSDQECKN